MLALGLERAMPLVLVPSITSNLLLQLEVGEFSLALRRFWPMFAATLPGIACGLWLLTWVERSAATATLGVVLLLYALHALS